MSDLPKPQFFGSDAEDNAQSSAARTVARATSRPASVASATSQTSSKPMDDAAPKVKKAAKVAPKVDLADLPDLLTISEVSSLLRVSPLTIKRWGKRGKLPAIRINSRGDRRYKKQAVLWMLGMSEQDAS